MTRDDTICFLRAAGVSVYSLNLIAYSGKIVDVITKVANLVADAKRREYQAETNMAKAEIIRLERQRDELQEAVLAMIDREDNDCMPAGWSVDRVREIAKKIKRRSLDRAVRRQHDERYLAVDVARTRTGRAT